MRRYEGFGRLWVETERRRSVKAQGFSVSDVITLLYIYCIIIGEWLITAILSLVGRDREVRGLGALVLVSLMLDPTSLPYILVVIF